jgi:putative transposase
MRYRRTNIAGGTYFFTVNLVDRSSSLLVERFPDLRASYNAVKDAHPFATLAWVVLPDHLHVVWRLPEGDADFPTRWTLIKAGFSRRIPRTERIRDSRRRKGERGIWQRRYWEHLIREEDDLRRHVDYIHFNPVKHGYVKRVRDWPYSSFHHFVRRGWLPIDWCDEPDDDGGDFGER